MSKKNRRKNVNTSNDVNTKSDYLYIEDTIKNDLTNLINEFDVQGINDKRNQFEAEDIKLRVIEEIMHRNLIKYPEIVYKPYVSESIMPDIIKLITKDLSEPYSIYTYRYFIHNWPDLCFLAMHEIFCIGAIVCKLDVHKQMHYCLASQKLVYRGYIAMLATDKDFRRKKIGTNLVLQAIITMIKKGCDEVVLETEVSNEAALSLYEALGFVRDKRLYRYYLNGADAYRLKLWLHSD